MVYAINNRFIYRGFHQCLDGTRTIKKPDGKVVKGRWLTGELVTIPMSTPPGAAPQMPVLCLVKAGHKMDGISSCTVCACTISLFSGTWAEQNWDNLLKAQQQRWLKAGRSSADWKGVPVFEGDIFYHKTCKCYYVVTFDLLHGFKLENPITGSQDRTWFFGEMVRKGSIWNPPRGISQDILPAFHKKRGTEVRVEEIFF